MKKTLCMLLCLLLILPVFAACANQKDDNDGSTTTANSGSSTTTEEEGTKDEVEEALKLIDVDYNKKTFEILTRKDVGNSVKELKQDSTSSEPLENAVYACRALQPCVLGYCKRQCCFCCQKPGQLRRVGCCSCLPEHDRRRHTCIRRTVE